MTNPDFRALCAELVDALENARRIIQHEDGTLHINTAEFVLRRARAALAEADGPAVPEGREPASVATQPSDEEIEEWADACPEAPLEEMDPEVHGWRRCFTAKEFSETIRAALARFGRPAAAPVPEPGEVGELVVELRRICFDVAPCDADAITRAATLLQQQAAPVPVSERLPGPEDCDKEGRCWWLAPETAQKCAVWCFGPKYPPSMFGATHWLPANALPLPAPEGGEVS